MFMKMDSRWGYNNMSIKERDKQKATFSIPEGVFELIVIFFELTNLPTTLQMMMNDSLRDMIEARDVVAFIDNIIVGMETKKENRKNMMTLWKKY